MVISLRQTCCCCYWTPSKDGSMAEHHGAPEAGQLPKDWTRGRRETENRQRASDAKIPQLDSAE